MKRIKRNPATNFAQKATTRFLILVTFLLTAGIATVDAQEKKMTRQEKEDAWRAERLRRREAERRSEYRNDSIEYAQAVQAIRSGSWALEASSINFNNGVTHFVTPSTNYLSGNKGQGVVQTAFDNSNIYSPNGLGGVTLEGNITNEELTVDNSGNIYYNYTIQGIQISATVNIILTASTNQATATVDPNFSSWTMTMSGSIYPYSNAGIIQGTPDY